MINPDMTLREVFDLMKTMGVACIDVTLDDEDKQPMQGFFFTDGPEVTAKVMGAAKAAREEWERE